MQKSLELKNKFNFLHLNPYDFIHDILQTPKRKNSNFTFFYPTNTSNSES